MNERPATGASGAFSWTSLSGPWRGVDFEMYGSAVWVFRLDLTFEKNGHFSGPCTLRSYPRYNPGPATRTRIDGVGVRYPDGTVVLTGAIDFDTMIFFPVLRLSLAGGRRRLEGRCALASASGADPAAILGAARGLGPDDRIEETAPGAALEWYDEGALKLRQQSAADLARDRLRARVRQAIREAAPAGSAPLRTIVGTRRAAEGGGWEAQVELEYIAAGAEEVITHTAIAPGKSGKEALKRLIEQLTA